MDVCSTEMTQPHLCYQLQIYFSKSRSTMFLAFSNTVMCAYYLHYALWLLAVSLTSVPLVFSSASRANYVASETL